ncbi:MAG: bifunctional acetate--CoA ligase family protein/GNAT family N-acetyltransferase [Rhodospirillales bacterium]|nr:bifunctional acetate--CoA ligase family protein/GNAT family N-acetyltransferase [Rhodospirillales bacterium]
MPILNLDKLFYPRSVAVIGASNQEGSASNRVMHNLLHGGFEGPIMPVSNDRAIAGVLAYRTVDELPITPDLAVVCSTPLPSLESMRALAERGTRAAILIGHAPELTQPDAHNGTLRDAIRRCGLRILGPDCLGVMVPGIGLNASVAHVAAQPGGVAFVSQSSTVCASVLDWACERDIGFSHFISLGDTADICFGDVVDYLGNDQMTRAILLYVESIQNGRTFMSAGRGASRNKPILVIKAGRTPEGQFAATGERGIDGEDEVYDAAIRRAGMLRVYGFNELFSAVETLGRAKPPRAERLAVVSNGRGMGVMAVDTLILSDGRLARLSDKTLAALAPFLPAGRAPNNPVAFDEDAQPNHYGAVVKVLANDPEVDAIMVLHAPTSAISSTQAAEAVVHAQKETRTPVLTSWMGGFRVAEARHLFADAHIPTYDTPNQAVDAFVHLMRYRRNQEILIETPTSTPVDFTPSTTTARAMVAACIENGRNFVVGAEAAALLASYGIRSAEAHNARTPQEAVRLAATLGYPVQLQPAPRSGTTLPAPRRESATILETPEAVLAAATRLLRTTAANANGFSPERLIVQKATSSHGMHEGMIRVVDDPVFGPVIVFGHGGAACDVIRDRAVALPPLNTSLARELVARTRLYRLIQGHSEHPDADIDALCLALVQVSQMVIDLPELAALAINPLLIGNRGVFAADAQILIAQPKETSERRLAIRPYPKELEERFVLPNGRVVMLRPIRPEDEPAHHEFVSHCSPDDLRLRFFHLIRRLPHSEMARLTQIDYDREMAFVAVADKCDGVGSETLGVVRTITDLHNDKTEYAILVRSDLKGQRLGWKLMDKIIRYTKSRGTRRVVGLVLSDNRKMLDLVHRLGFTSHRVPDDDTMEVELDLETVTLAD